MTDELILFSQMVPPIEKVEEFEKWYDTDHIPHRLVMDGFVAAHRYWNTVDAEREHLAIYNINKPEVLQSRQYQTLKSDPSDTTKFFLSNVGNFTRYILRKISDTSQQEFVGDYLSVVAFSVPEEDRQAFDEWYLEEHIPLLMKAPDWLRVHRYERLEGEGGPWNVFALHELASREVMHSPERERARQGPLRDELAQKDWFPHSGRWLYRRKQSHSA